MTEKDVMTALECCTDGTGKGIIQAVIDLIYDKNYKLDKYAEEINRLQADKEALIAGQETLQKHIAEQKAEIERLDTLNTDVFAEKVILQMELEKARAETIKDFTKAYKDQIKDCTGMFTDDGFYVSLEAVLNAADFIKEKLMGVDDEA